MHILILGAGAIGSLLGARLSEANAHVSLLTTNHHHIRAIRTEGLAVDELDGSRRVYHLPAFDHPDQIQGKADLILVAVKSYDTVEAISSVDVCRGASTLFLTLQNGIGNWELISRFVPKEKVLAGVTAQGATLLGPGCIRHGGNGATFIGEPQGPPSPRVEAIVDLFRQAGLQAQSSAVMQQLIWEKLLINVGINAITALTGMRNGGVAEHESARDLCRRAVGEALNVARAKGFPVADDMPERALAVAKATAANRSSMGQDVDRRAPTEIEAINGAIVRFGEELSLPTPVNRTLTQLVKTLEAGYLKGASTS